MVASKKETRDVRREPDPEPDDATNILPMMNNEQFEELKRNIELNGQVVPIELWQGRLIDGRNRLKACKELGIEPRFKKLETLPSGSVVEYVAAANLHRRHLTASQRAMVAARMRSFYDDAARQRRAHRPDALQIAPVGNARDQAGLLVGVSGRSVDSATKVLRQGDPVLIEACERGALSVTTAARLAALPKELQRGALERGRQAVAEALRGSRPQPEFPVSDDINELLNLAHRIEDRIRSRWSSLADMAKADGYDKRMLAVQTQQLRMFASSLAKLTGPDLARRCPMCNAGTRAEAQAC